jgi:hypothetical protein
VTFTIPTLVNVGVPLVLREPVCDQLDVTEPAQCPDCRSAIFPVPRHLSHSLELISNITRPVPRQAGQEGNAGGCGSTRMGAART